MSGSDTGSSGSILYKSSSTENDYETDKDMGVVQLNTKGSALDIPPPYHEEPILDGERAVQDTEEIDIDGIPIASLEERFYDRIRTEQWCRCSKCKKTHLNGIREHRCCTEIKAANEKFKGLRRIKCITQLEEYDSLTKTIVLENVGALLKDRNGRTYKQRSEQGRNEYLRAVAYRWIIRYIFGFLGWDNARPLPACIYNDLRTRFPTKQSKGYLSSTERSERN